jgi:hypothetical protein
VRAHRFVTLSGVGGAGKTRLALEVASRLADEFPMVSGFSTRRLSRIRRRCRALLDIQQALEGRIRLLVFDMTQRRHRERNAFPRDRPHVPPSASRTRPLARSSRTAASAASTPASSATIAVLA